METPKAQYELLCAQACTLVQSVGEFIRHEIGRVSTEQVSDKSLNNLVSYVDRTAEQQLVAGLQQLLPHSQVLAEEGTTVAPTDSPYTWVIDPLDGTTNFVHQLPFFSISVALQRNDTLIMGIVYEVVRGELFCAWEGSAAYLNGRAIGVSATADLKDSLLATGFPYYQFAQADQYLALFGELMRQTRGIRRLGSAALDLAYTACGRFDAYFEYNLQPWDVAAGAFIVQQAGGTVTDFAGGNTFANGKSILASNAALHNTLQTTIKRHFGQ